MKADETPIVVVRLKTTFYHTNRGFAERREFSYLKRACRGFNFVEEDTKMVDVEDVVKRIVNVAECKDGVYRLIICNESKDWETGIVDDYDYRLIPYLPPTPSPEGK